MDYVVEDTPFAEGAKRRWSDVLAIKEFTEDDFPEGTPAHKKAEPYAIAVRVGESELLDEINSILDDLTRTGKLHDLQENSERDFYDYLLERKNK